MELTSRVFVDLLSPLAAFSPPRPGGAPTRTTVPSPHRDGSPTGTDTPASGPDAATSDAGKPEVPWETSFVNPQNRIDALHPWDWDEPPDGDKAAPGQWRLDGVGADGQRVFAVPGFAVDSPPLRIDVHLPPPEEYEPAWLRDLLAPELLFSLGNGQKTESMRLQPALQHLVRALRVWVEMYGHGEFQKEYNRSPFGSRIVVTRVVADVKRMAEGIYLVPDYDVEAAMLSVEVLRDMWKDIDVWPQVVCWEDLKLKRQLHEAITVVEMDSDLGDRRRVVFKSLLRDQRYLYNEIKTLLSFRPHPHVAARPLGLVVKRGRFGSRLGVCGFLMEYFEQGNLQTALRTLDMTRRQGGDDAADEGITQKLEWARQITSALVHVNSHPAGFFPDLKPDNIVLRGRDIVLLDFEQRGGWYAWSPPEVAYVEYMELLVEGLWEEWEGLRDEIQDILARRIPGWRTSSQRDAYWNSDGGFSAPWRDLLRKRMQEGSLDLEKAQVYMLGRLLWCIFEEKPLLRCGISQEVLCDDIHDTDGTGRGWNSTRPRFPQFRRASVAVRELIRRCTEGDRAWSERLDHPGGLFVRGRKLFAVGADGEGRDPPEWAKEWWGSEVERAKRFMVESSELREALQEAVARRPTFLDVLGVLERLIEEEGH
ncbi:hypothetical protein QBC39DRAFT_267864 [Podospora conica]|nr:hypothetical protein QBC39DRAFT_267864 [Schizothecium conicum]